MRQRDLPSLYRALISSWSPSELLPDVADTPSALTDAGLAAGLPDALDWMGLADLLTYLPGDILTKVDRASMAVGLEARVPLLDHRVVEHAWTMSSEMRDEKQPLRELLARDVPRELFERPKQGFAVPLDSWLRGPLRDWAEALLDPASLRDGGLEPAPIRARWQTQLGGGRSQHHALWTVLMWQAWRERWI